MSEPLPVLLSRAARLEYDAGRPERTDEERQWLMDDARRLRLEAGQEWSVVASAQQYNFQRGVRGMA